MVPRRQTGGAPLGPRVLMVGMLLALYRIRPIVGVAALVGFGPTQDSASSVDNPVKQPMPLAESVVVLVRCARLSTCVSGATMIDLMLRGSTGLDLSDLK